MTDHQRPTVPAGGSWTNDVPAYATYATAALGASVSAVVEAARLARLEQERSAAGMDYRRPRRVAVTSTVRIVSVQFHDPPIDVEASATCCTGVPGGGLCPWHTDDHDHVRALAVEHALKGHRVLVDDPSSTTVVVGVVVSDA